MVTKDERASASNQGHDDKDVSGEKNEWKFREPYKIHQKDGDEKFEAVLEGYCHCERVSFSAYYQMFA